jgi:hypothetical protein
VSQKARFKVKEIWAIRVRLKMRNRVRDLALFDVSAMNNGDLLGLTPRPLEARRRKAACTLVVADPTIAVTSRFSSS